MKKTLCIAVFCAFSLQANAGFWDSLTSIFSSPEPAPTEESKPAKASPAEKTGSITTTTTSTTTSNASSSEVSISSSVSLDANTAAAANQTATGSMIQTGIQLLPLLSQTLGVSTSQATGGMGALLQTAQSLLSGNDFNVIANAIPGASGLLNAAPAVTAAAKGEGGLLGSAMKMATDSNPSLKAGAQLVSQFKSLGMGAEMIPKFTDVGSNYLKQNGNPEASILLDAAISGAM
tara:strand:+ start:1078 stop:1779 length:702 start_codon:yes stop_codon:yes gene_type:complete